ncbi:MAG: agmatine deiminase family protein [Muribaculaceae bacterium]|nr:agmatine deiminase family protein [Muribaculaceae bacterium]
MNISLGTDIKPTLRLPAEWEPTEAVLVAWPPSQSDWAYMLDDARRCIAEIIAAISRHAKVIVIGQELPAPDDIPEPCVRPNITLLDVPVNDTWTRDYGPITVFGADGSAILHDFKFNGWGLKFAADRDNLATCGLFARGVFGGRRANRLGFVLEGGSIESDGQGTLLTTEECLLSANRNGELSKEEVEEYLKTTFGLHTVQWLGHGALEGDDTDGHVDTLARLVPPGDVIVYTGCQDPDDIHFECLQAMRHDLEQLRTADGRPYTLAELPLPDPIYDPDDGSRLPATYANFLYLNGTVLLPVYGQPMKDLMAVQILEAVMPGYEIIPIDCRALIRQHGSLHCTTMQLPTLTATR